MYKKKCKYCGNFYNTYNKNQKFCKTECGYKWRKGRYLNSSKVIRLKRCLLCKNIIPKIRSISFYRKQKFCSYKCCGKYTSINGRGGINKLKKNCAHCGKSFETYYNNQIFCGKRCCYQSIIFSESQSKSKSGENNPSWNGGISFEPYDVSFNKTLKRYVAERDNWICQICFKKRKKGHIHHIHYIKKDSRPETLVFVDISCHIKTNSNRDYWFAYFCMLMNINPEEVL
jgi:hypothetical protein